MTEDLHGSTPARFDGLDLPDDVLANVRRLGFETPTPIQAAAIPALLEGRDVVGVARTGTGKTAAFGVPLAARADATRAEVQALVLTPTRELATQVAAALTEYSRGTGLEVVAVYGGSPFHEQRRAIARGAHVVVGTPGRLMDHLDRGTLRLDSIRMVVLDEADEMLKMGFADDVDAILSGAPSQRQTALFSATMPPAIRRVAERHLTDPVDVSVRGETTTASGVRQEYALVPPRDRAAALARVLEVSDAEATIVFVRTKAGCDELAMELASMGVPAAVLNGGVPQEERERIMRRLREGAVDTVIATDVAARGLDVDRIDLVVNVDAPHDVETYVHRIGRTGRADRTGRALTFLAPRQRFLVNQIEKQTGARLHQITPPSHTEVFTHRAASALGAVPARVSRPRHAEYRAAVEALVDEHGVDALDAAAALLAQAAGDDGTWTPPPPPERRPAKERRDGREGQDRGSRTPRPRGEVGTPYRIGVGRRHGARPASIVGAITGAGGVDGSAVGRIDIRDDHTVVEMMGEVGDALRKRIATARIGGRRLFLEPHDGPVNRAIRGRRPEPRRHGQRKA